MLKVQNIILSKRMKNKVKTGKPDHLKWNDFFMAIAMLSAMKQGKLEKHPECTVS